MDDPAGLWQSILEMRSFAKAYSEIERSRNDKKAKAPTGPMVEQVHWTRHLVVQEDRERQHE